MTAFDKIDLLTQHKCVSLSLICMNTLRCQFAKSLLIISGCFCVSNLLLAAPSKLESNSPFLPPGYSRVKSPPKKPVNQPNSPLAKDLEFRGVVQLDGKYQFSLFKKSENQGYWILENSSENGIGVSDFDEDSMSLTVTLNGRSEQLSLMAASENPLPVVAASPSAPTARNPSAPSTQSGLQVPNRTRNNSPQRRTIPRRRVIVPPKNNPQ